MHKNISYFYFEGPPAVLIIVLRTGVGAGGEEQKASSISIFHLPWLAFVVSILFVGIKPYALTDNSFLGLTTVY